MSGYRFVMLRNGSPCKDCPKKGCGSYHDDCPDYINFKAQCKKDNLAVRDEKRKNGGWVDHYEREKER